MINGWNFKVAIYFTKKEFLERKSKVIEELKKQDLNALLMSKNLESKKDILNIKDDKRHSL